MWSDINSLFEPLAYDMVLGLTFFIRWFLIFGTNITARITADMTKIVKQLMVKNALGSSFAIRRTGIPTIPICSKLPIAIAI